MEEGGAPPPGAEARPGGGGKGALSGVQDAVVQGVARPVMPVVLRAMICLFSLISFSVMASFSNRSNSAYNFQLACGIVIWIFRCDSLSPPPTFPSLHSSTPMPCSSLRPQSWGLSVQECELTGGPPPPRPIPRPCSILFLAVEVANFMGMSLPGMGHPSLVALEVYSDAIMSLLSFGSACAVAGFTSTLCKVDVPGTSLATGCTESITSNVFMWLTWIVQIIPIGVFLVPALSIAGEQSQGQTVLRTALGTQARA